MPHTFFRIKYVAYRQFAAGGRNCRSVCKMQSAAVTRGGLPTWLCAAEKKLHKQAIEMTDKHTIFRVSAMRKRSRNRQIVTDCRENAKNPKIVLSFLLFYLFNKRNWLHLL